MVSTGTIESCLTVVVCYLMLVRGLLVAVALKGGELGLLRGGESQLSQPSSSAVLGKVLGDGEGRDLRGVVLGGGVVSSAVCVVAD